MGERVALILTEPGDQSSDLVGLHLQGRGCRVLRVTVATLARALIRHCPDAHDGTSIELPGVGVLTDAAIGVVLNRLSTVDLPQFAHAPAADRDYAGAEFTALLTSWLQALNARGTLVANLAIGDHPYDAAVHPLGWHALAAGLGIGVGDFTVASSVRGGDCAGLARVGATGYPRGSDLGGWYRTPAAADTDLAWAYVFGDDSDGLGDQALGGRSLALVRALGLGYAALGFAPTAAGLQLREVAPRPPLTAPALAGRCADWLFAALVGAA